MHRATACPPSAGGQRRHSPHVHSVSSTSLELRQGSPGLPCHPLSRPLGHPPRSSCPTVTIIYGCASRPPGCGPWAGRLVSVLLLMVPPQPAWRPPNHRNLTLVGKSQGVELRGREFALVWSSPSGRREGGEKEVGCFPSPPCDHLGIVCRCWGVGGRQEPGTHCNEHNQPVPGAFLWVSYLSGLGALGEGGARPSHGPEHTGFTSPGAGSGISGSRPEPDVGSETPLSLASRHDALFSLLFSLPRA